MANENILERIDPATLTPVRRRLLEHLRTLVGILADTSEMTPEEGPAGGCLREMRSSLGDAVAACAAAALPEYTFTDLELMVLADVPDETFRRHLGEGETARTAS